MVQARVLACLLWLFGCATVREPTSPYTLTNEDINIVATSIHAALQDGVDAPRFRSFKATRAADGKIYVCGWLSSKDNHGVYADDQPFIGSLFAGQFLFDAVGKKREDKDTILEKCLEHGIKL